MRSVLLSFLLACTAGLACAQQWSLYGGAGLSYDALLRDPAITTVRTGWPFRFSGSAVLGGGFKATNGFDVFGESTIGFVNVKLPLPEIHDPNDYLSLLMVKLMAGSGPRIEMAGGNAFRPFIQLGCEYLAAESYVVASSRGDYQLRATSDFGRPSLAVLFGGGVDYQFAAKVPSSINLNVTWTPLNAFRNSFDYEVSTATDTYPVALQGKLLQVVVSYRVHLNLGRRSG